MSAVDAAARVLRDAIDAHVFPAAAAEPPNHVPLKMFNPAARASAIALTKLFGPGTNAKKRG